MESEILPTPDISVQQKESIKLIKTSKSYNWEIRVFLDQGDKKALERLAEIDALMKGGWGEHADD